MSALFVLPGDGKAVHVGGLGVVFKLFGQDTGGRLAVVEHPLAAGALGGPPHVHHREDEISYVLEGEFTIQMADELIMAPTGTLIFKPRGVQHTFWNHTSAPARLLEIISPAGFEHYFEELVTVVPADGRPPADMTPLIQLAQRYDLEVDMGAAMALVQKYHVRLG